MPIHPKSCRSVNGRSRRARGGPSARSIWMRWEKLCSAGGLVWSSGVIFQSGRAITCWPGTILSCAGGDFCSVDGLRCPADGSICSVGGLICSPDGFICSINGFIYSVDARNWWVGANPRFPAVNITFRRVTKTVAGPAFCSARANLTVQGAGRDSILPNSVIVPAPPSPQRAKKTVSRVNKTIADGKSATMDVTFTDS